MAKYKDPTAVFDVAYKNVTRRVLQALLDGYEVPIIVDPTAVHCGTYTISQFRLYLLVV